MRTTIQANFHVTSNYFDASSSRLPEGKAWQKMGPEASGRDTPPSDPYCQHLKPLMYMTGPHEASVNQQGSIPGVPRGVCRLVESGSRLRAVGLRLRLRCFERALYSLEGWQGGGQSVE